MPRTPKPTEYDIADDFDGTMLPDDTEPLVVSIDGDTYELYLSDQNMKTVSDLVNKVKKKGTKTSTGSSVDRHGYDLEPVRDWAVRTKKKTKGGDPITRSTKILHQGIWDAYKADQEKN